MVVYKGGGGGVLGLERDFEVGRLKKILTFYISMVHSQYPDNVLISNQLNTGGGISTQSCNLHVGMAGYHSSVLSVS